MTRRTTRAQFFNNTMLDFKTRDINDSYGFISLQIADEVQFSRMRSQPFSSTQRVKSRCDAVHMRA